jgi:hypothetical protein
MPIPAMVEKQDSDNSCGYHAISNAISVLDGPSIAPLSNLMDCPEKSVSRLAPGTINAVLIKKNLPYKVTTPMDENGVMPVRDALRKYGADAVFIAKANMRRTDAETGAVTDDKHAIVLAGFTPYPGNSMLDSWQVLDSAVGPKRVLSDCENLKYAYATKSGGKDKATFEITIEGCQILERSATPGGATTPAPRSFFSDLFARCCCCFGKPKPA